MGCTYVCGFYLIKSSHGCQSLERLSANLRNVREGFKLSPTMAINSTFCFSYSFFLFLFLPFNISFWYTGGDRDGWRKLANRAWSGTHGTCHYLSLGHNGVRCRGSAEEGGQRGRDDDRIRSDKATEVTAGDGVLLCLHYQGVHGIKAIPRQPHCALLAHERCPFKVQSQRGTPVGNQVKPRDGSTG